MQKPTQAFTLVKGPWSTFDLIPKWVYLNLFCGGGGSINIQWKIPYGTVLAHLGFKSNVLPESLTDLSVWIAFSTSSPQQGFKCLVKGPWSTFDLIPKWEKTLSFEICHGVFIESAPPPQKKIKYQSWHRTLWIPHDKFQTTKFFPTWGLDQRLTTGL
jgi:hypothetical protein